MIGKSLTVHHYVENLFNFPNLKYMLNPSLRTSRYTTDISFKVHKGFIKFWCNFSGFELPIFRLP